MEIRDLKHGDFVIVLSIFKSRFFDHDVMVADRDHPDDRTEDMKPYATVWLYMDDPMLVLNVRGEHALCFGSKAQKVGWRRIEGLELLNTSSSGI